MDVNRLQRQVRRIRNHLANALARGRSKSLVTRIERRLRRCWEMLDEARRVF
jgi:hypothetical protein